MQTHAPVEGLRPQAPRFVRTAYGITEGFAPEAAALRDAALRRLLTLADVLAALLALIAAVPLAGDDRLMPASLLLLGVVILASRLMRLHDRDELVLAKTTLNEAPALFHLATLYALIMFLGQPWFVDGRLGAGQGVALWAAFLVCSLCCRAAIRRIGVRHAPAERCLVIGCEGSDDDVRAKLAQGGNMHAEVVGMVSPDDLPEGPEGHRALGAIVAERGVQRVIIACSDLESERLLDLVRDIKAFGVKVTIKPRLLDVIGSAVVSTTCMARCSSACGASG